MAEQDNQERRPWNPLDEWKLRLESSEKLPGATRNATLKVAMIANQLRFQVFTNVENDANGGKIEAKLGAADMYSIFEILRRAIADPNFATLGIPCYTGPLNEQVLESTVLVGRDSEKKVFVAVVAADKERPRVKFRFFPSSYHRLQDATGNPIDQQTISEIWASGWLNLMTHLCANVLSKYGSDRSQNENSSAYSRKPSGDSSSAPAQHSGNSGGFQKKPWQGNNGDGGSFQKKPWQGNGGGGGGFQKKPWQGNNGGGGGGYKKPWQGNKDGGSGGFQKKWKSDEGYQKRDNYSKPEEPVYEGDLGGSGDGFDDDIPF